MSGFPVPCAQAWTPIAVVDRRDIVKIFVSRGGRLREYQLHAEVLKARSGYFRERLQAGPDTRIPMQFPDKSSAIFDIFALWIYQGVSRREDTISLLFLCRLFAFGTVFDAPLLRNSVVDAFLHKMHIKGIVPYGIVAYLENASRYSLLRNAFLDVVLRCGEVEEVDRFKISLAKGFFTESVFTDGPIVPFGMRKNMKGFVEVMRVQVCETYHEHPNGEEVIFDGEETHFFDPPVE